VTSPAQPVLTVLRDRIAHDPDRFAVGVFNRLFAETPFLRELFPSEMSRMRATFTQVVDHVLDAIANDDDHAELIEFLAQLGRDHRKFGVIGDHYWLMYDALMAEFAAMLGPGWSPDAQEATSHAMMLMTGVMRGAADSVEGPAVWHARVVQKFQINRERAVVRLVPTGPRMPYRSGEYTEVQVPQHPHLWRNLSPATPPNERGELEFHVHAIPNGLFSGAIVRDTQPGDVWRFGQRHGTMQVTGKRPVLMVGGGSGLSPLRAILLEMAHRPDSPPTHVFYGTRHPGELYELGVLAQLASTNPWLRVTAVAETPDDPWWIGDSADPRQWGFELRFGRVGDIVAGYSDWTQHEVLLSGPAPMVFHTQLKLRASGVAPDRILHDPLN
jgi:NAD(P)H-flavin reductase/hemoglobin-like flavoprotein